MQIQSSLKLRTIRWSAWVRHVLTVFFLLLSTVIVAFGVQEGFEHGAVNNFRDQSVQLPIIYSYADASLFPGDLILQARSTYVTWLYPLLGVLSRVMPLYWLMFGLYVVSVGLTVTAIYSLGETLFPARNVGILAVILWMAYFPNPGGDFIHSPFPTHTTSAIGLQLWGVVLIFRKRYGFAALLIGLAANINAMTSLFILLPWLFALLGHREEWSWKLIRIPVIMGVAAFPALYWRFVLVDAEPQLPLQDFVNIMRLRLWYAIFPFSISGLLWIAFFGLLGITWYASRYAHPEINRQVMWMSMGTTCLVLIGTIFTELIPTEFVMQLQLVRSTWLINLFVLLYLANLIREQLNGKRAYIGFWLVVVLAIPRFLFEYLPTTHPAPYTLYMDFDPIPTETAVSPFVKAALLVTMLIMVGVIWVRTRQSWRLMGWSAFAVICFTLPIFLKTEVPSQQVATTQAWQETLFWIQDNTAQDAVFVTPPMLDGFRVDAKRTHLGDWKDGTLLVFNSDLAYEWEQRMIALGFDADTFSFHPLRQADLCAVRDQYHADYAVVFREWGIEGESIFENDFFSVLWMDALKCGSPQPQG